MAESQGQVNLESLKKAFLIGLGATVLTAEKVRDAVKDLVDEQVKKGVVKPDEAKKLASELKDRVVAEKGALETTVKDTVKKAIHSLGLVTRSEMEAAVYKAKTASGKTPSKTASSKSKSAASSKTASNKAAPKTAKPAASTANTAKKPTTKKAAAKPKATAGQKTVKPKK